MRHIKEFSRFAQSYENFHIIQNKVAQTLIEKLTFEPKNIIDLGCGSGTIYKNLSIKPLHFLGIDLSQAMLDQHPKDETVALKCADFDDPQLFKSLEDHPFELLVSSSSLQWSQNLELLFSRLSALKKPLALTLFTSNTFKTLHDTAQTVSPLRSFETVQDLAKRYFDQDIVKKTYTLVFDDKRSMFRYLKKSGVSGVEKRLNYAQTKALMQNYPLDYLEFEVAFIQVGF